VGQIRKSNLTRFLKGAQPAQMPTLSQNFGFTTVFKRNSATSCAFKFYFHTPSTIGPRMPIFIDDLPLHPSSNNDGVQFSIPHDRFEGIFHNGSDEDNLPLLSEATLTQLHRRHPVPISAIFALARTESRTTFLSFHITDDSETHRVKSNLLMLLEACQNCTKHERSTIVRKIFMATIRPN